jgi:2-keto-3-deoxy-L-rhamnonate aldolase RhmA
MPEEDSLTMVPFFSSSNHDAEMEATNIHGVLEANGIPSILIGPATLPSLEFQVQVPEDRLADAVQAVAEARAAGPAAAEQAELESEEQKS